MAEAVKHLPRKHEDLDSIPRTHAEMPGVVACTCSLRAGEVDTDRSLEITGVLA